MTDGCAAPEEENFFRYEQEILTFFVSKVGNVFLLPDIFTFVFVSDVATHFIRVTNGLMS